MPASFRANSSDGLDRSSWPERAAFARKAAQAKSQPSQNAGDPRSSEPRGSESAESASHTSEPRGPRAEGEWSGSQNPDVLEPEIEMLARLMDSVFEIPGLGIRFGLDAIVGLIPGVGDTLTSLASLYILNAARRYGVPRVTIARMAMNLGIDYLFGAVPVLGDAFDVYWKANLKNVELLRHHLLATRAEERRARVGDWLFVGVLVLGLAGVLAMSMAGALWILSTLAHLVTHGGQI